MKQHARRRRLFCAITTLVAAAFLPIQLSAQQAGDSPVKIFILAGQSNMVGMGDISPVTTPGTLEYIVANDPDYAFMGDGAGGFEVLDDVWIRYNRDGGIGGDLTAGYGGGTDRVGPELGFGHAVGELYGEQVLLIKYAAGGRSLGNDFLPPSSGPYPEPGADGDPGYHYQQILDLVADVTANLATYFPDYDGNGYEIVGFAWHQGWNDRIDSTFSAAYEANMENFINDIRNDLSLPDLPFVIATSAMDSNFNYTQVEEAQLAMADASQYPSFAGNVKVIDARQPYKGLTFWQLTAESPRDEGYHWNRNAKTYTNLGLAMADTLSTMVPARCPYRLEASGDGSGVALSWSEGTETPTNLQIRRDGVEIAASAPLDSPSYLDASAAPGLIEYELNFPMPGDTCPPLTLTFDAGITDVEAYRLQGNVKLTWANNLGYTAIEVRRDGVLIEPALDGSATSYIDTEPPESGTATYSLVPTNGTATPTEVSINLDGLSPGNAYIYEPFADADASLVENPTGAGLAKRWVGGLNVDAGSMTYGDLPTSGNQTFNGGANTSAGALIRTEFAEAGLLDDGAELWFSFLTNNTASVNTAVYFLLGTDEAGFFTGMADGGEGIGVNIDRGATPQAATWAPGRSAASGSSSIASDTTALVVGKITWGADAASADTIEIYLPETDLVLPAAPVSTTSATLDQSQFDVVSFGGKNAGSPKIDEIRFAANYNDVIALDLQVPDEEAPGPDPMTWANPPAAEGDGSITMTATTASDPSGVEYYFTETSGQPGGSDSGWQDSPSYTDTGLEPETTYAYTVKARDKSTNQNETAPTATTEATTDPPDTVAPTTPGFAAAPSAFSATEIGMTASEVTDPSGIEYYFTETSGNPGGSDSGWQDAPSYTDTGLDPETSYAYTVTARDKSVNQNESAPSTEASATTPALPSGPGGALIYESFEDADPTLNGNAPGTGLTGTWSSGGYSVENGSYLYGTLPISGNRTVINSGRTGSSVSTGSTLSDVGLLNDGATLWFSVLHLTQPSSNGNMDFGFALGTNGISGSNAVPMSGQGIGFSVKNGSIVASIWDDSDGSNSVERTSSGASFTYGEAVLVVGEIIWGSGGAADTINLYTPDTNLNLGSVVSTFSKDLAQTDFDIISFGNKADEVPVGIDEIRFGASYEDAVGIGIGSDYDIWASNYPGANLADPAADLDGDGFTNEEERIWGLDPTTGASTNPVAVPLDPTTGTLTYTRRNPTLSGISYSYEWSDTLATGDWTSFTPASETPDGGEPVESVEITLDNLLLQEPKLFIRVEATTP
jgi:hypothetical protein